MSYPGEFEAAACADCGETKPSCSFPRARKGIQLSKFFKRKPK